MSKFQGPKCQEMHFPAFDFQIPYWISRYTMYEFKISASMKLKKCLLV